MAPAPEEFRMSRDPRYRCRAAAGFAAAAGAALLAIVTASTGHAQDAAPAEDTKAHQTFTAGCIRCHPIDRIAAIRRTRGQWEEVITTMITARGAQVSDEDFDVILTYLTKHYGRVDINRARADDVVEVLAIPDKMAAAIVAYRKEHGPFEDFAALVKVPGVDREALEKRREAISF